MTFDSDGQSEKVTRGKDVSSPLGGGTRKEASVQVGRGESAWWARTTVEWGRGEG